MPNDPDDLLIAYVREALLARERGEVVDVAKLCAADPELAPAVAEVLGLRGGLRDGARAAERTDRDLGRVLGGRYRLTARLGRGAMGAVFAAHDRELDREVAVKLFDTLGVPSASDEERFEREAKALAALDHRGVVAIFDRGRSEDGTRFLVMERLRGASLAGLLRCAADSPPPESDFGSWLAVALDAPEPPACESNWLRSAARWCAQVADGLAAAHAIGILHRDVKPSNVFVTQDGDAVLLDFGIAARDGDPALTAGDSTLGTPWYMAPEQVDRARRTGPAIDVYGLSATLYHLVTGRAPYDGDALAVLAALPHVDPVPASRARRDLPRDLGAIVERGMERDPSRRYLDARELGDELTAFLAHRRVRARPIGGMRRTLRLARRHPARTSAFAASMLALVLLGVAWPLWRESRAQELAVERDDLLRTMPALIAIDGQSDAPLVHELAPGGAALGALDRLLAIDPGDLPHRLWRAVLRLDRSERDLARQDLDELVARAGSSAFTRALAQRYLALGSATATTDGDGTPLPAPVTDFDRFLAAFDELRNRHRDGAAQRADDHLAACADRYLPARDLRLIALVERGDVEQRRECFQAAADLALELEGRYGHPTARTLAMRGAALLALRRVEEARGLLEAADRLRPDRHGTLHNLGMCYRRLGRLDDAIAALERAHALRPTVWNTPYMLALAHKDRGDWNRANAVADALDAVEIPAAHAWRRPELRATIALRFAIDTRANDATAARAAAQEAQRHFEAAAALAPAARANDLRIRARSAASFAGVRPAAALPDFLLALRREPDDPYQISNLASLLPDAGIEASAVANLRAWLRALSIALAEGDPALQSRERDTDSRERKR
ncbi:MAG: protein kinase [Planctomycetes bacterium]|nr:protein kinase [Planctomycetota bacterium]